MGRKQPCYAARGWRKGNQIGTGSYGSVYLARDMQDGFIFAVKKAREGEDNKFSEELQRELEICKDLRHPHVVSCLGHEVVKGRLCIYLEYVPGGSMRSHLEEFGALEEPLLRKASRGVLKGLDYLHTFNPPVVHRDLKGANVLVDLSFCAKLADFGCSKRSMQTQSFTSCGSAQWCAPEVFKDNQGFGRKADIWSFGCVVLEMATAADPWGKNAFDNFMQAVHVICMTERTPPIPEAIPLVGRELASRCLLRDPEERPWCVDMLGLDLLRSSDRRPAGIFRRSSSRASRAAKAKP
jgi:mitogen-activated protein kinase kinase kinase